jgi:hypothetical protein
MKMPMDVKFVERDHVGVASSFVDDAEEEGAV